MAEKAESLVTREEKIAQAKELYSRGSRNYLIKSYNEAADDLSQVCSLYEELYGGSSDELGMPYLLYAKSLIALALEENKVIDVPDEQDDDDDDDDDDEDNTEEIVDGKNHANGDTKHKLEKIDENLEEEKVETNKTSDELQKEKKTEENVKDSNEDITTDDKEKDPKLKEDEKKPETSTSSTKPDTKTYKNGETEESANEEMEDYPDVDEDMATNLQLAWETLELAAKIFERQGESALPNLAEVKTELGNIEFENNILVSAREDYNEALRIYEVLPSTYRRPMAEIHYKIGLTYLMENFHKESAESLKNACKLLDEEIEEAKNKDDLSEKEKNNIQDMEETRQEIWAKITEIEESRQALTSEVRAALDSYINPNKASDDGAGPSTSSQLPTTSTSSSPSPKTAQGCNSTTTDISHLIKRKKRSPSEENESSPVAKRPAT